MNLIVSTYRLVAHRTLLLIFVAVFAVFTFQATATAQVEGSQQNQIMALHSNKCVDVSDISTANGQAVQQWQCFPQNANQNWAFEAKGRGYLIKARHSGKCLDVKDFQTGNGAPIIQWDCHGSDNQLWTVNEMGGGYQIKSVQSGKCLDVRGPSVDDGAAMQIWDCVGPSQTNQLFKVAAISSTSAPSANTGTPEPQARNQPQSQPKQNAAPQSGSANSVEIAVTNTLAKPVVVSAVNPNDPNDSEEVGQVGAQQTQSFQFAAGRTLHFWHPEYQAEDFLGEYVTTTAANQTVTLPLPVSSAQSQSPNGVCWKDSYGRGVGVIPKVCPSGTEEVDGLCYSNCRQGYHGAVTMCVQSECPSNYRNDPLHCFKPGPITRSEYPWKFGDGLSMNDALARCRKDHGQDACEIRNSNTMVYSKCPRGYKQAPVVTNLCTPSCEEEDTGIKGMKDIGISCEKSTYDRGVGRIPECASDEVNDAGLCYKRCDNGYAGAGPVCWGSCPAQMPVNCGAMCAESKATCALATTNAVTSPFISAGSIALIAVTAGGAAAATAGAQVAKTAATTSAKVAAKLSADAAAKASAKAAASAALKAKLQAAAKAGTKAAAIDAAVGAVMSGGATGAVAGATGQTWDPVEIAYGLDPTGIAEIVRAFNNPICTDIK